MLKVMSLFSGIGAYEKALDHLGIDYKIIGYCEILKDKSKAYSILHNVPEDLNFFDVTKIDTSRIEDFDLLCYSPPCQSFSISGKLKGVEDLRGTLFYSALKVIKDKRPKYCVMENVANLTRNKFTKDFKAMCQAIEMLGYNNYWKCINAKDFIPQNRERVYLVSIRKDIDDGKFEFPLGFDRRCWEDVIDLTSFRDLTERQQRVIDLALKGKSIVKVEGEPQLDRAVITVRQSGVRFQCNREYPTVTAYYGSGGGNFTIIAKDGKILGGISPVNCFRLMGFDAKDCEILEKNGFKKSSLYRMAGDSVCVPVLEKIFENLLMK